jgi:hypothetical protein
MTLWLKPSNQNLQMSVQSPALYIHHLMLQKTKYVKIFARLSIFVIFKMSTKVQLILPSKRLLFWLSFHLVAKSIICPERSRIFFFLCHWRHIWYYATERKFPNHKNSIENKLHWLAWYYSHMRTDLGVRPTWVWTVTGYLASLNYCILLCSV